MKKLLYILLIITCTTNAISQTIGIGTPVPDTSVVLDIFSNNKGVLIPRINDTPIINKPSEGMLIYNKNTQSPFFYNGSKWLSLGARSPGSVSTPTDRITYQITGTGFNGIEREIYNIVHGVSTTITTGSGPRQRSLPNFSDVIFYKDFDINSKSLNKAAILGENIPQIEFKFYATGSPYEYLSYKFKDVFISSYQVNASGNSGGPVIENISLNFAKYTMRDVVNNLEFSYDLTSSKQAPF